MKKYLYWKEGDMWLGYLEEYPDYMTQGQTMEELKENLRDIYAELTSGTIECVRRVAELEIS
ncbi:MAG TPA: type II toxin-antitoxin system HicB family antitoxin [Phycisphaerales bacterium]|nr:type II toxin-antitoxin system HicB family antitoxin [Phycisphaerales bacterium]